MSNLPVGQTGFGEMDESKVNPRRSVSPTADSNGIRPFNKLGSGNHDHNWKGRSVNTGGSDYHDVARPNSGLNGNFAEKDASIAHLTSVGKMGAVIRNFSGTNEQTKNHTNNIGPTAQNNRPVDEVYKSATSHGVPKPDPIIYRTIKKTYLKK